MCIIIILVDGNWGEWRSWGTCSLLCNTGNQTRMRSCSNPTYGGITSKNILILIKSKK